MLPANLALAFQPFGRNYVERWFFPLVARIWKDSPAALADMFYAARTRLYLLLFAGLGFGIGCAPALFRLLDAGGVDVMVLDGEAQPAGGMGVSRQAKDEIYNCPPVLLVIGRADDRWLATWSKADAVISHPIDPVALARELAALMRARARAAIGTGQAGTGPAITAQ